MDVVWHNTRSACCARECPAVAGSPDAALRQGSQQSQASREQGAQRCLEEHQRGSPAPRKMTKRVGCPRREPGDADPAMHSRKKPLPGRRGSRASRGRSESCPPFRTARVGGTTLAQGHCLAVRWLRQHDRRQTPPSTHRRPGPSRAADRAAGASFVGLAGPEVLPGVPLRVQASRSTRERPRPQR